MDAGSRVDIVQCWRDAGAKRFRPQVPQPIPAHEREASILPSPSYLDDLCQRFLERQPPEVHRALAEFCGGQQSLLSIGTCCSGTDSPLLSAAALAKRLKLSTGSLRWSHACSSERDLDKQALERV